MTKLILTIFAVTLALTTQVEPASAKKAKKKVVTESVDLAWYEMPYEAPTKADQPMAKTDEPQAEKSNVTVVFSNRRTRRAAVPSGRCGPSCQKSAPRKMKMKTAKVKRNKAKARTPQIATHITKTYR